MFLNYLFDNGQEWQLKIMLNNILWYVEINENFLNNPNFLDYDIFKGLLSHSVMVFGCMYLFIMGYIKVNALNNTISAVFGLLMFLCIGMLVNGLYSIFGLDPVNSMYLQELPFP